MEREDYKTYIQREFERRKVRNSFYSLRAYARDLGLAPSTLSELLAGKKGLSATAATSLAKRMGLDTSSSKIFELSVAVQHARSSSERSSARKQLKTFLETLATEPPKVFTILPWIDEAVLALTTRTNQDIDEAVLAEALGVPKIEVRGALKFLRRLGFIEPEREGEAYLSHRGKGKRLNIDYESILERALNAHAMKNSPSNQFFHEPLLLQEGDIPEATRIIKKAILDLKKLHSTSENSQLFYIATQLFALETKKKEKV
ncbi:MAG: TIGR02147 family protein [Oligoflexales bacterium]